MGDPVLPVTVAPKIIPLLKSSAVERIRPFLFNLFSLVARKLRILQDFAGIRRGNPMILFGISSGLET
jgi:hypothetical protein